MYFILLLFGFVCCESQYVFIGEWGGKNCTGEINEISRSFAPIGECQKYPYFNEDMRSSRWNITEKGSELCVQNYYDDKCTQHWNDEFYPLKKCNNGMTAYVGTMNNPPQELFQDKLYGSIVVYKDSDCVELVSMENPNFRTLDDKCRLTLGRISKAKLEDNKFVRKTFFDIIQDKCTIPRYTEEFNFDGKCDYHDGPHEGKYYYKVELINYQK